MYMIKHKFFNYVGLHVIAISQDEYNILKATQVQGKATWDVCNFLTSQKIYSVILIIQTLITVGPVIVLVRFSF